MNYKKGDKILMVCIDTQYNQYDSEVLFKKGVIKKIHRASSKDPKLWYEVDFFKPSFSEHLLLGFQIIKFDRVTKLEQIIYGIPDEALS